MIIINSVSVLTLVLLPRWAAPSLRRRPSRPGRRAGWRRIPVSRSAAPELRPAPDRTRAPGPAATGAALVAGITATPRHTVALARPVTRACTPGQAWAGYRALASAPRPSQKGGRSASVSGAVRAPPVTAEIENLKI